MKNYFKFMMIAAAAAVSFAACEKEPAAEPEEKPEEQAPVVELTKDLKFTLEATEVAADQAKISVSHNGTTNDTWYGFVTTDVAKADAALVTAEVEELKKAGKITGLKKQTSTSVTLRGLEAETSYKYIVFGVTAEGEVYGAIASKEFKTAKGELAFTENAAWTVKYEGAGNINGTDYEHTVSVTSSDQNPYFITAVSVEEFDTYGIKAIAEDNIAYMKAWVEAYNAQNGSNYTVADMLFVGNGVDAFMLEAGDWYAIAIGVDANGELSGLYAKSEVISVEEEEPTAEYAAWLGDWTITGANGITQQVTISKAVSNKRFYMSGYEGEGAAGLNIELEWMAEEALWVIYNQTFGTYQFQISENQTANGEVWLFGQDAEEMFYYTDQLPICVGGVTPDGTYAAYGYEEVYENEDGSEGKYVVDSMLFLVYFESLQQYSYITPTFQTGFPTFPYTFTRSAETCSATPVVKNVKVFTNLNKTFKAYAK